MRKTIFILFLFFFSFLLFFSCGEKATEFEPDFSIILKPISDFVVQGDSVSFLVKLISVGGFNSEVKLSIIGVPDSVETFFEDSILTPPDSTTLWMKADSTAPVGQYMLALSGSGGGKTNNTTLALKLEAKIYELKLYFAKDGEERYLSLNPDPTNPTDYLHDTSLCWDGFLINQDFTFDSMKIYLNFYVHKTSMDEKGIIHFEVNFNHDSIYADDWKRTFAESDTGEDLWMRDTVTVPFDSPQTINKNDEIKVTLSTQGFYICTFRYGVDNSDPYIKFH